MIDIQRERYFDLSSADHADLLQTLAPVIGRRAQILGKDIWLCQVLDILFQLPCRKPMALPTQPTSIEVSNDAEKLWVFYPSAVENTDSYVRPSILFEFGGRNLLASVRAAQRKRLGLGCTVVVLLD